MRGRAKSIPFRTDQEACCSAAKPERGARGAPATCGVPAGCAGPSHRESAIRKVRTAPRTAACDRPASPRRAERPRDQQQSSWPVRFRSELARKLVAGARVGGPSLLGGRRLGPGTRVRGPLAPELARGSASLGADARRPKPVEGSCYGGRSKEAGTRATIFLASSIPFQVLGLPGGDGPWLNLVPGRCERPRGPISHSAAMARARRIQPEAAVSRAQLRIRTGL
jgi:hypothetical protein